MSRALNLLLLGRMVEGRSVRPSATAPFHGVARPATVNAEATSMPISTANFMDLVTQWASANVNRIRLVWPLAGGWEAWAQAEIAGHINANVQDAWIEREAYVYPDRARADFLVNNPFENPSSDEIVVEMKCESLRNWAGFIDGLRYDTWKLNGPMRLGLGGARKISLGLFFSPESEEQLAMLTGYEIRYTPHREIGIAFLVA